ncbi:YdaU family protein [Magnetospirillum aberrantis]|uniref:YdaU family protein n=1 Tax=Magnetospirillum aberrantis SpK TaxID=908842 RepID=A0A7C9UYM4_9PROT|nr:YdaU family protein [Magnetospirillum aberrantis]NFV80015.1 YdaU family protein [Magnetospirillum aberrantis SpK]
MSATTPPEPLVPADVDLRDFPFTPMFRSRLFGSSFHARVSDAGWRAGVTLWLKSWDQVPAGTLPDDDIDLCRLAELGRDLKSWRKVRMEALWGWMKCSDGRLHHHVVAEGVMEAWTGKLKRAWGTDCARIKKANQRNQTDLPVPTFEVWLSQRQSSDVPRDKTEMSPGTPPLCPEENGSNRKGERKGQGQGKGKGKGDSKNLAAAEEGATDGEPGNGPDHPPARERWRSVANQVLAILGTSIQDPTWYGTAGVVAQWLADGADPERDILPTVTARLAAARKTHGPNWLPRGLGYFTDPIAEALARNTTPLTKRDDHGQTQTRSASDEDLVARILERRGGRL